MGELVRTVSLDAAIDKVFDYVADPHNAPNYIGSIRSIISGPSGTPVEGESWQAEAMFLGSRNTITLKLDRLRRPNLVRFALEGNPQAVIELSLAHTANDNQTQVSLTLDVPSVPTFLLNGIMGPMLAADMERLKAHFG